MGSDEERGGDLRMRRIRPERRVTLADVAKADGTHVTTVSLALRNSPRLAAGTRERIQALAKKMGYVPDPALQSLISYRNAVHKKVSPSVIAYLTNWTTRWGWKETTAHPEFFEGAREAAEALGYKLEHFWAREPNLTYKRLDSILKARGIHGVILASYSRESDDYVELDWTHLSGIKIDYLPHRPVLHNVSNNQCSIVRLAMAQCRRQGYQRVGMIMHRGWDHSVDNMFTAGYLCEQQNFAARDRIPALIFPDAEPVENWINERGEVEVDTTVFRQWYERHRPEVIIGKASFIRPVLKQLDIHVPKNVCFVDLFLDSTDGRIAGVSQNHHAVGALAVEILAGRLAQNRYGVPQVPTTTHVDGTWISGLTLPQRSGPEGRSKGSRG